MTVALLNDDPDDRALLAAVHPPDWINPTPANRYHLVVVGAGTAGLVAAAGAAGVGARVALVERDLMGGDCLNAGCVPSKALLASARTVSTVRNAGEHGVQLSTGPRVDFAAVMQRLRRSRTALAGRDSAERFRGLGVDVFLGQAQFTGPDSLQVADRTLRFRRAVIATGARAAHPAIPGLGDAGFFTNENLFTLTTRPPRLGVIGGGPIGCELAQAFARLGSQVTLLQSASRILPRDDAGAADRVRSALERDGVVLLTGCAVQQVRRQGGDRLLRVQVGGSQRDILVDEILVGAGRQPNVEEMGLEAAGVAFDRKLGVRVNDHLRTTNSRIFAAGDVCSAFRFTHAADAMARIVVQNALFFGRARLSALTIPWCTYTSPELGQCGLTEAEAHAQGVPVQAFVQELREVDRAVLDGAAGGFLKVLVRAGTDHIVGATVVAEHAGEMLGELSLAMTQKIGLRKLASTIHPYPTQAEAIKKVADAYNRTRLTPAVRWLLRKWLAWGM